MLRYLLVVVSLMLLAFFAGCQIANAATALGVQDDGRPSSAVLADSESIGGSWTRTTVAIGEPGVAARIRAAHEAGQRIILTVGGTGTQSRKPSFVKALRYIHSLPRADKYTIDNEPDLDGVKACTYRKGWMKARRILGKRLLFGDFSPAHPLTFTSAVRRCGPLPRTLDVALHPYQSTDPLAPGENEGSIGSLSYAKRWLKKNVGVRVNWWLTEFGYIQAMPGKSMWNVSDAEAAWLWPRAVKQAERNGARVLIAYTAKGDTWNTRPGPLGWCSLTRGRACPGAERPVEHREPTQDDDDERPTHQLRVDPVMQQILAYAAG